MFKQVGTTEKPDILAAKMLEGRIGIFVDGSPIALTLPYILVEDFQSVQDYLVSPYRATVSRLLRLVSLVIALLLPAYYVAAQLFKLQLLPLGLLMTISGNVRDLPLSPSLEMFFLMVILEILIEASVRMPKYVGLALSVVGALVLGDTAVKAGIVSSSAIIIVALSGIAAYTLPDLAAADAAAVCLSDRGGKPRHVRHRAVYGAGTFIPRHVRQLWRAAAGALLAADHARSQRFGRKGGYPESQNAPQVFAGAKQSTPCN